MRGIIVVLLCLVLLNVCDGKKRMLTKLFQLSDNCKRMYVNVHDYDEIDVKSMELGKAPHSASAGATCLAYFKTTNPGQGICIRMDGAMVVSDNVSLSIHTGPYGAERIFRRTSRWRDTWCFAHSLVVVNVSTTASEDNVDRALMFSFTVTNVSLEDIQKRYYMDTFMECGMTHKLSAGQTVRLQAERKPRVSPDVPMTCDLTFETTAEDNNEQLCLDLQVTSREDQTVLAKLGGKVYDKVLGAMYDKVMPADKAIAIEGLNKRFYSTRGALKGQIACSGNKELKLTLTRNMTHFINFRATLTSQRHPHWEIEEREAEKRREKEEERRRHEESEEEDLKGLAVVKGITYLIACIDSVVGVGAAVLAVVLRKPQGPWKRWAEEFNAKAQASAPHHPSAGPQDPGSYGSMHTCKDGNYPELPLEGATPTNEVLVETHTY